MLFGLLFGLLAAIISLFTVIFSKSLVLFIYGKEFILAAPILSVYIFSLFGTFFTLLIYQELLLSNKTWLITLLPASTAIINILLNIVLIPNYGGLGAATATMISYSLTPMIYYSYKLFSKKQ